MSIVFGAHVNLSDEAEAQAALAKPGLTRTDDANREGRQVGFKTFLEGLKAVSSGVLSATTFSCAPPKSGPP